MLFDFFLLVLLSKGGSLFHASSQWFLITDISFYSAIQSRIEFCKTDKSDTIINADFLLQLSLSLCG